MLFEGAATMKLVIILALSGLFASTEAQWAVKTSGIPRTADGKANLTAPAPRTVDGKPDLSGLWEQLNARDRAYYLKGIDFPWTPAGKAVFAARVANNQKDNPEGMCLPRGLPKADAFDIHKIVQTPDLIMILYEYGTTFRQIFTDGRALPKDPNPAWMGYSAGHWEGDTLVVESNGFNGKAVAVVRGVPDQRCAAPDGADAAARFRAHGHPAHDRRSEVLHKALDDRAASAIDCGYGAD